MGRAAACACLCLLAAFPAAGTPPQTTAQQPADERWEQALALYAEGPERAAEIVAVLEDLLADEPENRSALRLLGLTHLGNARADLALPRFEELIRIAERQERIFPGDHFWRAMCLNRLGRNEEAREVIRTYAGFLESADAMKEEPLATEYADLKARLADAGCTPEMEEGHYRRPCFGLVVEIPGDWSLAAEYLERGGLEAVFSLPPVWSEKKGEAVVNAAAIHVYRDPGIRSIKDLMRLEKQGRKERGYRPLGKRAVEAEEGRAVVAEEEWGGVRYKSLTHFRYENGTGYVIIFSSTPGTYDQNLPRFEAFLAGIRIGEPAEVPGGDP